MKGQVFPHEHKKGLRLVQSVLGDPKGKDEGQPAVKVNQ